MKVTIHQPEHLPYLGFFEKASKADVLVLLDNVPFEKNYFQNRNRIVNKLTGEPMYITLPVKANMDTLINEVEFSKNEINRSFRKNLSTIILNYENAKYFYKYCPGFSAIYSMFNDKTLCELNTELIKFMFKALSINTEIVMASSLKVTGSKSQLLYNICKEVEADTYISGRSGRDYLDLSLFKNIKVEFQDFVHPIYRQQHKGDFIPNMSVLDALFNRGPYIMNVIKQSNDR